MSMDKMLIDHMMNPKNYGTLPGANAEGMGKNPANGEIEEEIAAKDECRKLSDAVGKDAPQLAKFFDFINYQENYHIELMTEALAHFEKERNG